MDFIAGAKILAERIGDKKPASSKWVPADARPLFHWCGVNPGQPEIWDVAPQFEAIEDPEPA